MRLPLPAAAPAAALAREWLLRNDRGDVAAGTVSGAQVRLRHIALTATSPYGRPAPCLLRLDARAGSGHHVFDLTWRPADPRAAGPVRAALESFTREPWPTWRQLAGETRIEKQLVLLHDQAALLVVWRHLDGPRIRLAVTPALALDGDAPATPPDAERRIVAQAIPGRVRFTLDDAPRLTLWHDGAFLPARSWRPARDGDADAAAALAPPVRGEVPGFVEATLGPGEALHLVLATDEHLLRHLAERGRLGTPPPRTLAACVGVLLDAERGRIDAAARAAWDAADATARSAWAARHRDEPAPPRGLAPGDARVARFARALDEHAARPTRLADPLLGAGGAAALRAVRGLVALRRHDAARDVLMALGQLARDGLVPSGFSGDGAPRYESPEPSLWLVLAAELFARRTGELEFVERALVPVLAQVFERFRAGTRLGVRVRDDGLLASGDGEARTDLNALWYSAQAAMGQLTRAIGQREDGAFHIAWAREHQVRVNEALWDEALGAPYVALTAGGPVRGLEPSLLLAASLSPPVLEPARARLLVDAIDRGLMTDGGPREAPDAPLLRADWMGHYLTAALRAHGRSAAAQADAVERLARLEAMADQYGAGWVPDAFELGGDAALDAGSPQAAGDPVSLAGNAELLRFWVEELDHAGESTPAIA